MGGDALQERYWGEGDKIVIHAEKGPSAVLSLLETLLLLASVRFLSMHD